MKMNKEIKLRRTVEERKHKFEFMKYANILKIY